MSEQQDGGGDLRAVVKDLLDKAKSVASFLADPEQHADWADLEKQLPKNVRDARRKLIEASNAMDVAGERLHEAKRKGGMALEAAAEQRRKAVEAWRRAGAEAGDVEDARTASREDIAAKWLARHGDDLDALHDEFAQMFKTRFATTVAGWANRQGQVFGTFKGPSALAVLDAIVGSLRRMVNVGKQTHEGEQLAAAVGGVKWKDVEDAVECELAEIDRTADPDDRDRNWMTLADAAAEAGVSLDTVSGWRRRKRFPIETRSLAGKIHVDFNEVVRERDAKKKADNQKRNQSRQRATTKGKRRR